MKMLALCLTMLASSGCLISRSLVVPDSTPLLDAPEVDARWGVTEVFVRSRPTAAANDQRDYTQLQGQLATRLRRTLEAQTGLGHRKDAAAFGVEVVVDVTETSGLSPWMGLGAGLETAVLIGGASVGMAVGGPPASLIGLLIATPVAIVVALTPPSSSEHGELEATVVLRRKSDGAAIATRHVRSDWRANVNGYHLETKLAAKSGAALPELEHGMLEALREMLTQLPSAEVSAATAAPASTNISATP